MRVYQQLVEIESKMQTEIDAAVRTIKEKYEPLIRPFYAKITEEDLVKRGWVKQHHYSDGGDGAYIFEKNNQRIVFYSKTKKACTYCGRQMRLIINHEDLEDYSNGFY